jgi:RimJ/RimL family protein N-acetyltransferase
MLEVIHNHPIDFDILKNLYKDEDDLLAAWPEALYPFCVEQWKRFLSTSTEYASLIFKFHEEEIGHILLKPNDKNQLFICFVILDKKFRGKGLIKEMLNLTEEFAAKNFTHEQLWLHVDPNNLPALKTYENFGFKKVLVTELGRYRMVKDLSNEQ